MGLSKVCKDSTIRGCENGEEKRSKNRDGFVSQMGEHNQNKRCVETEITRVIKRRARETEKDKTYNATA